MVLGETWLEQQGEVVFEKKMSEVFPSTLPPPTRPRPTHHVVDIHPRHRFSKVF
jgi:hypothetical protein